MKSSAQKYTLSLPASIYEDLSEKAKQQNRSIKEIVRWCLELGLVGLKIRDDPNAELILREKKPIPDSGNPPKYEIKESVIILI